MLTQGQVSGKAFQKMQHWTWSVVTIGIFKYSGESNNDVSPDIGSRALVCGLNLHSPIFQQCNLQ